MVTTIPARFASQVARDPDATALVFGTTTMSFAELDRRSNALAWLLHRRGVRTTNRSASWENAAPTWW